MINKRVTARQAQNEHLLMKAFSKEHAAATWDKCPACQRRFRNQKVKVVK